MANWRTKVSSCKKKKFLAYVIRHKKGNVQTDIAKIFPLLAISYLPRHRLLDKQAPKMENQQPPGLGLA